MKNDIFTFDETYRQKTRKPRYFLKDPSVLEQFELVYHNDMSWEKVFWDKDENVYWLEFHDEHHGDVVSYIPIEKNKLLRIIPDNPILHISSCQFCFIHPDNRNDQYLNTALKHNAVSKAYENIFTQERVYFCLKCKQYWFVSKENHYQIISRDNLLFQL